MPVRTYVSIYFFYVLCLLNVSEFSSLLADSILNSSNKRYVFILDASGSMAERIDGTTRMAVAKDQLLNFMSRLPFQAEVGLVAYGNRIPGCNSARLYQPVMKGGATTAMTKLTSITPSGSTPIANTLEIVGEYILRDNVETEIIFISDGMESCEGDPVAILRALKVRGKLFKMHIMGIDLDPKAEEDLMRLSMIGNGRYFKVHRREDMENAFISLNSFQNHTTPIAENTSIVTSSNQPFIKIISILPYSQNARQDSYILHFEYEGWKNQSDYLIQMNIMPRVKRLTTKEVPPLRDKRMADISQIDVQYQSAEKGKGKMIVQLNDPEDSETTLELWNISQSPRIVAKSDIKLIQNFSP